MRRGIAAVIAFLALAAVSGFLLGQQRAAAQQHVDVEKKARLSEFMDRKLEDAQALLAGLARHDLEATAAAADRLGLVCVDLSWNVLQTDEYLERSTTFRRTIATLASAARDGKLERAQLAWLDLAGQCFSCHEYVRDRK